MNQSKYKLFTIHNIIFNFISLIFALYLKTWKMSEKPTFRQNRGRPNKYQFPQIKGDFVTIGFTDKANLVAIRMSAYSYSKRKNLSYRTWVDGSNIVIEAL
jgi:hypothetical protein